MSITTSAWLDRFFDVYYRHQPVSATFIGVHEQDARLPDYSPEGIESALTEMRGLLDQVEVGEVDQPETLWESVDRLLARNYLIARIWELTDPRVHLGNPCVYTGEAIFGVVSLFLRDYAPIDERASAAVQRMRAIPTLLEQGRRSLAVAPRAWIERAINECVGAETLLSDGISILIERHGVSEPGFRNAAEVASNAFRDYRSALETARDGANHDRYGCGPEAFDLLLRLGHCLDLDHAAVDAYARRRLADARLLVDETAGKIDPQADPKALLARLADDHPSVEEYYPSYQREFGASYAFAVERDLLTWPDYPIVFEPIPDWARGAAPQLYFLFYRAPAAFDSHVIQRYLVTPVEPDMPADEQQRRLRAANRSQIRLNHVIHHGGIGHHVQNWWAYRALSRVARIAAIDCALRIAMLCGGTMAEGWACYATDLMAEQGYVTPLEQLSEYQSMARMAGRAIVDAGLHTGTLTFDEAIAFYRDEIGMSPEASRAEAIKNSMFPGAAMMYLIGTDAIHDLRAAMWEEWGDDFSLRRFHDTFLSHGSIPVALTSKLMRAKPIELDGFVTPRAG